MFLGRTSHRQQSHSNQKQRQSGPKTNHRVGTSAWIYSIIARKPDSNLRYRFWNAVEGHTCATCKGFCNNNIHPENWLKGAEGQDWSGFMIWRKASVVGTLSYCASVSPVETGNNPTPSVTTSTSDS